MGGRGSSGAGTWKAELKKMADSGRMPAYITGTREQQAMVLEWIDKLYPWPDNTHVWRWADTGTGVNISFNDSTTRRGTYPSGEKATIAEKNGVRKQIIYLYNEEFELIR